MNQQLNLLDLPPSSQGERNVFLALFPPPEVIGYLSRIATSVKAEHGLTGKLRPPSHWHSTLGILGQPSSDPEMQVQRIDKIVEAFSATVSPFAVTFDRVMGFHYSKAIVLAGERAGNAALMDFQKQLSGKLLLGGCPIDRKYRFQPHITLLYDEREIQEETVEAVTWVMDEIVLVYSYAGETRYEFPCRWKLKG